MDFDFFEKKKEQVEKVSNPITVYDNAVLYLSQIDENFSLNFSPKWNKKYMIKGTFTDNVQIHFGDILIPDYTKHKNEDLLIEYKNNNHHCEEEYFKYTPDWFTYYLFW